MYRCINVCFQRFLGLWNQQHLRVAVQEDNNRMRCLLRPSHASAHYAIMDCAAHVLDQATWELREVLR